jgi:hypothetical protein
MFTTCSILYLSLYRQVKEPTNSFLRGRDPNTTKYDRRDTSDLIDDPKDPWPWLDKKDPRRLMTDKEILDKLIDMEPAKITQEQKDDFMQTVYKHRESFSLRDEIGSCPKMEIKLVLKDYKDFQIRPYPKKEDEKGLIDDNMRKGCLLGILKRGLSAYSSPIMLLPRKLGGIPRIVTDFRYLNSRLVRLNPSIPLVRDAIQLIGNSQCEVMSLVDLRDAYHTLHLARESQQYCGITPYYGSLSYQYQRLPMGLSVSPAIFQEFITTVMAMIPKEYKKHYLAIIDDVMIYSSKKLHAYLLELLFVTIARNGLRISPKKCQLFRTELIYMGYQLLIKDRIPCITPMKTRTESMAKLTPPTTQMGAKSSWGWYNLEQCFVQT